MCEAAAHHDHHDRKAHHNDGVDDYNGPRAADNLGVADNDVTCGSAYAPKDRWWQWRPARRRGHLTAHRWGGAGRREAGQAAAWPGTRLISETDFTDDLAKFDVPTLVLHGEDDQIVPVKNSAVKSARLIKGAKAIYYPGAPHGITATHLDQVNAELLEFLRS
jgi:pimeloyl-ACP methyl ester carboxylesterase